MADARPCARCGQVGRFLTETSKFAAVEYYRCDNCGEVWTVDRQDSTKPARVVTQRENGPTDKSA